jgi:predicted metal-dependent peptidase
MEVQRKIEAARFRLCQRYPFLARAVFAMVPVLTAEIPAAMGVDRAWRLYINPELIAGWSVEETETVLYHEVLHLILDHAGRAEAMGVEPYNARAWNVAADAEINDDIAAEGFRFPPVPWRDPDGRMHLGEPVFPRSLGQPEGLLAESYYHRLPTVTVYLAWMGQEGSGVTGVPAAWEGSASDDGSLPDGLPPVAAEILRRALAQEIQRAPGTVPGSLARWAQEHLAPLIDWRRALQTALRRGIASGQGQIDYRYDRPSRRQAAFPVILPRLRAPQPRILVVLDTSGSIDADNLGRALRQVEVVVRQTGASVDVASGDAALQTFQRGVFRAQRVALRGGGGTDMGCVLEEVADRGRWDIAVLFTDGQTPWPERNPLSCPVLVVLPENGPQPPAWARVIRVPDE